MPKNLHRKHIYWICRTFHSISMHLPLETSGYLKAGLYRLFSDPPTPHLGNLATQIFYY